MNERDDTITDDTITRLTCELHGVNINLTDSRGRQTELSSLITEAVKEKQRQEQYVKELRAKYNNSLNESIGRAQKVQQLRRELADALNRAGYGTDAR